MTEDKTQRYSCKIRNLQFTETEVQTRRSLGVNCYQGSLGDICNSTGELCAVIAAYQNAVAKASARASETATFIEIEAGRRDHEQKHPLRRDDGYINPHIRD